MLSCPSQLTTHTCIWQHFIHIPFPIVGQVDRLYSWKSEADSPIRDAFKRQRPEVLREFKDRKDAAFLQLNEQGLNVALYWENPDKRCV